PYTTLFRSRPVPSAYRSAPRSRGNPFLPAYAGQKFFPPGIPLGTKFGAEPRTRRKAARTLSAPNFPVCVPSIRTCRLDGTFLPVSDQVLAEEGLHLVKGDDVHPVVQVGVDRAGDEVQLLVGGVGVALDHVGKGVPAQIAGVGLVAVDEQHRAADLVGILEDGLVQEGHGAGDVPALVR